jgi:hypothetical protein
MRGGASTIAELIKLLTHSEKFPRRMITFPVKGGKGENQTKTETQVKRTDDRQCIIKS